MKKIILVFLSVVIGMVALWQISKSRTFQFAGELISNVQATDSLVALTFDDGPTPEYTDEVLGILDQYGIRATFFVTGRETERFPEQAAQIVAAGHQLGNHSYSHPQMIFKSGDFILEELERTDVAIRKAGYQGTIYFRPPFGKKNC